ncbi:MAG: cadherin domain-containing protein [Candidatus Promineifilaceae bacterium]|nr:cadherin domain-containing protein [Anaerolineaceae bacterium]
MRRKRVLIILSVLFAATISVAWLSSVLADASLTFNEGLTVSEADSGIITSSLLQADDPDLTGETLTYTLITTPTNGFLALNSVTLTPTAEFTQADIDSNLLVYTHDDSETSGDSFDFTVKTITSTIAQTTFLITVTPDFDQQPVVLDQFFELPENSAASTPVGAVAASDADAGDSLAYTILNGNTGNPFILDSSGAITVNNAAPLDFETNPSLTFTVQVQDLGTLTDTAVITVNLTNQNEPPIITGTTFSLPENASIGAAVGSASATDPDASDSVAYSIVGGNLGNAFAIGSSSGAITVNSATPLDFETNPTLTLTVQAADLGALTSTAVFTVNLSDANDAPVLATAGPFSLAENSVGGTAVGTISATDQDLGAGDLLTYTIASGNSGNAFAIGSSSGQITVATSSALDYETTPSFNLTIRVTDSAGATDTEVVVVNLTNVNEPPTTSPATYTPNENLGNGVEVGDVPASDPEGASLTYNIIAGNTNNPFAVTTAGKIVVNNTNLLDFETTPAFTLTIAVNDGANPAVNATVNINLKDVNETPTVNNATFAIAENSSNATAVGTLNFSDPDAADAGNLTFGILSGNTGGAFAINNNGQLSVANSAALDYETTPSFTLSVIVTDTGNLENTANVTVNLNNLFDENPNVSNATFFVQEGAADGILVGTVSATDPELINGDQLTYAIIGGNTGTVFAINSSNGRITVPDTSKLNADSMPSFNLTVRVMDRGGQSDTATITINVSPLPISYVYLPLMLNNYPPVEPNNNCGQAYGISPGVSHQFTADDEEDWYVITLNSTRNISVVLSSFEPSEGQLVVYGGICGGSLTLIQNNGSPSSTKTINVTLGAGTYYVRVFSKPITNTTYNLQVNFN